LLLNLVLLLNLMMVRPLTQYMTKLTIIECVYSFRLMMPHIAFLVAKGFNAKETLQARQGRACLRHVFIVLCLLMSIT